MTSKFSNGDAPHYKWYLEEQGRFLKEARDKTALSQDDVSKQVGFDVGEIEAGKANIPMIKLTQLVELYRVPIDDFLAWQLNVGKIVRQMIAEHPNH